MILEAVIDLLFGLVQIIFGWINLPDMPEAITSIVDELFGIFEGSIGLLSVFVDLKFVAICIPILLLIVNFDKVYRVTMFIIRKLPFGIE